MTACCPSLSKYKAVSDVCPSVGSLMQILCPRSYTYAKNFKATKKFFQYGLNQTKLSYEVEFAVLKVLEK